MMYDYFIGDYMEKLKIEGKIDLTNIVMLGQRVLVKSLVSENQSPVSFYMPESAKEKSVCGLVVKIGDRKVKDGNDIDIKVNDHIIFQKWGGTEITINDIEYYIIKMEDLILVYGRKD